VNPVALEEVSRALLGRSNGRLDELLSRIKELKKAAGQAEPEPPCCGKCGSFFLYNRPEGIYCISCGIDQADTKVVHIRSGDALAEAA
jgi:hypothetical protein